MAPATARGWSAFSALDRNRLARLIASTGDSVTTYGEPWNMN